MPLFTTGFIGIQTVVGLGISEPSSTTYHIVLWQEAPYWGFYLQQLLTSMLGLLHRVLLSLCHLAIHWSCQHGKSTRQQKSCVLRTGSGAAMKAICADSKMVFKMTSINTPSKTTLKMGEVVAAASTVGAVAFIGLLAAWPHQHWEYWVEDISPSLRRWWQAANNPGTKSTSLRLVVVDSSHDVPASSKWPFDHPNGGPLTPEKVT